MLCTQSNSIPTLCTHRMRLVPLGNQHFQAFAELHSDPQTMQYIGDGKALDQVGAWLHLAMLRGHWDLRGYGVWAIEDLATGQFIGRAGLFHPQGWEHAELNWMITPSCRGKGLATEAAAAGLDFAFFKLGLKQVISLIRPQNQPSIQVATKLGGSLAETIDFLNCPMHVFRYEQHKYHRT